MLNEIGINSLINHENHGSVYCTLYLRSTSKFMYVDIELKDLVPLENTFLTVNNTFQKVFSLFLCKNCLLLTVTHFNL